jgi:hypothetical protein
MHNTSGYFSLLSFSSFFLVVTILSLFPTELVTKAKPNINSDEVHPQLSNFSSQWMDGAMVGAGSL